VNARQKEIMILLAAFSTELAKKKKAKVGLIKTVAGREF